MGKTQKKKSLAVKLSIFMSNESTKALNEISQTLGQSIKDIGNDVNQFKV